MSLNLQKTSPFWLVLAYYEVRLALKNLFSKKIKDYALVYVSFHRVDDEGRLRDRYFYGEEGMINTIPNISNARIIGGWKYRAVEVMTSNMTLQKVWSYHDEVPHRYLNSFYLGSGMENGIKQNYVGCYDMELFGNHKFAFMIEYYK